MTRLVLESGEHLETAAIQVGSRREMLRSSSLERQLQTFCGIVSRWNATTMPMWSTILPADGIGKVEGEDYVDASAGVRYEISGRWTGQPGSCLSNMRAGSRVNYN